jgi:hypothetical protein
MWNLFFLSIFHVSNICWYNSLVMKYLYGHKSVGHQFSFLACFQIIELVPFWLRKDLSQAYFWTSWDLKLTKFWMKGPLREFSHLAGVWMLEMSLSKQERTLIVHSVQLVFVIPSFWDGIDPLLMGGLWLWKFNLQISELG